MPTPIAGVNRKLLGLGWELKKLGAYLKKRGPALLLSSTKIFFKNTIKNTTLSLYIT
jgi:hypothetical protein